MNYKQIRGLDNCMGERVCQEWDIANTGGRGLRNSSIAGIQSLALPLSHQSSKNDTTPKRSGKRGRVKQKEPIDPNFRFYVRVPHDFNTAEAEERGIDSIVLFSLYYKYPDLRANYTGDPGVQPIAYCETHRKAGRDIWISENALTGEKAQVLANVHLCRRFLCVSIASHEILHAAIHIYDGDSIPTKPKTPSAIKHNEDFVLLHENMLESFLYCMHVLDKPQSLKLKPLSNELYSVKLTTSTLLR